MKPCPFCGLVDDHDDKCYFTLKLAGAMSGDLQRAWDRRVGAAGAEKDAGQAAFVDAVKANFAYGDYSFARTADGEYYNTVNTRSYGGRVQTEYAPVSMLWKIWRAAHTKAGTEPA